MARVTAPEDKAEELLRSGAFKPAADRVNVLNPRGELVSLGKDEVGAALNSGYRLETGFEKATRETADKLGGLPGSSITTFLGQAADEFAMGLPETAYDIAGDPFLINVKDRVKEQHGVANTLGGLTGFAASLIYGGPVGKVAIGSTKAGAAAARGVGNVLESAGVKKGAQGLGSEILKGTARYGVEGAASAIPTTATTAIASAVSDFNEDKMLDIDAAAESMLINGGIGILTGGFAGGIQKFINRGKKIVPNIDLETPSANQYVDDATKAKTAPTGNVSENGLLEAAKATGASDEQLKGLELGYKSGLKKTAQIQEISDATKRLSAIVGDEFPMLEEQLTSDRMVTNAALTLYDHPSAAGQMRRDAVGKMFENSEDIIKNVMNVSGTGAESAYQVGNNIKGSLIGFAENSRKKLGETFKKLRTDFDQIQIADDDILNSLDTLNNIERKTLSTEEASIAKKVTDLLGGKDAKVFTLNDLMSLKTEIHSNFQPTQARSRLINNLLGVVSELEENSIKRAADKARAELGGEAGKLVDDALIEMKATRKEWAQFLDKLDDAGGALGIKEVKDPMFFIDRVSKLEPIEVAKKLFPKGKIDQLKTLEKQFPEQFALLKDLKKAEIVDKLTVDGTFNVRRFMNEFKKLEPEERIILFGEQGNSALKDITTVIDALPSNATQERFTRTATRSLGVNLSLSGMMSKVSGEVGGLKHAADLMKNVESAIERSGDTQARKIVEGLLEGRKVTSRMGKVIKGVTNAADVFSGQIDKHSAEILTGVGRTLAPESKTKDERIEKLRDTLAMAMSNPEHFAAQFSDDFDTMRKMGLEKTTDKMIQKVTQITSFLGKDTPLVQKSLIDSLKPVQGMALLSDYDKNRILNRMEILENPFLVVEKAANGTLSRDHIEMANVAYPRMMTEIKQRLMSSVFESKVKLDYARRLNLSLLFGLDLDKTLSPARITSLQRNANKMPQHGPEQQISVPTGKIKTDIAKAGLTEAQRIEGRA